MSIGYIPGKPTLQSVAGQLALPQALTKVGLFSDSRGALCHYPFGDNSTPPALATVNGASGDYLPNKGFAYFAQMAAGGRIEFPRAGNYGITGNSTTQMAARADAAAMAMVAAGCSWVVIIGSYAGDWVTTVS